MGGKTQTATQQVSIPPEVMARYRAVNLRAEQAAQTPFQQYSTDPSAFVAPLTAMQRAGMQNINQAAGMTQPYFQTAAGLTLGGAQGVGPLTQQQIGYYQNPFTQAVVGSTLAGLGQQQGQQLAQQQAEAIRGGAYGGDRAGLQRAQLMGQQNLATAQAIAPLYQQGYQQAVQTAMGQQGVLGQDLQRQLAAGQQLGGLGAGAQQAALAAAQAQLGAGTAEQQTQQAGLQALYNQFLQERGYPFQVAQFLANIAMGTGALSGSTTTTTQPAPFFSDEDNKKNIRVLGKDRRTGLNIIAYDDADDLRNARENGEPMPPKRVSYSAQEIEEKAPGLVREVGGNKVVDPAGGLGRLDYQSMGGLVSEPGNYATGGSIVGENDMRAILAAMQQPLEFYGGKGLYGGAGKGGVGGAGYVPASQMAAPKLVTAGGLPAQQKSGLAQAAETGSQLAGLAKMGQAALVGSEGTGGKKGSTGLFGSEGSFNKKGYISGLGAADQNIVYNSDTSEQRQLDEESWITRTPGRAYGGLIRDHYAIGGAMPYDTDDQGKDPLADVVKEGSAQKYQLATPGKPPAPTPGLGSELMQIGSLAKSAQGLSSMLPAGITEGLGAAASGLGSSLAGAGSAAASGLGSLAAGGMEALAFLPFLFSDERMKDNVEQVGELYDGQPIYRYNMKGSPKTQLGLIAQDVERSGHGDAVAGLGGLKMVDYKRATDVAAGLAPREGAYRGGYQVGGAPEEEPSTGVVPLPPIDERKYEPEGLRRLVREYGEEIKERNPRFDPAFAERVFQGESGFDPRAKGDDKSSFGVPQLHMGNISARYPRPGLGDEFMRETGLDPRDPKNARAATVWAMNYASEKGWQPWTVARDLIARGEGPSGSRAPAGVAGGQRPTGVAGGQRPIGDVVPAEQIASRSPISTLLGGMFGSDMKPETKQALTSENLWVPALAGIGSMLASRSPYLAGAVGEGLVGGTSAYTALQKQQAEIDKSKAEQARLGIETARRAVEYDNRGFPQAYFVRNGRGGFTRVPFYDVLKNPAAYNLTPQDWATIQEAARRADIPLPSSEDAGAPPAGAPPAGAPPAGAPPAGAPPAGAPPAGAPPAGAPPAGAGAPPIQVGAISIPREGEYRTVIAPVSGGAAEAYFSDPRVGLNVNIRDPRAIQAAVRSNPALFDKAEKDDKIAQEMVGRARQLDRNITDLWQLGSSVNKISTNNLTGEGAGQGARAALVNIYNTAATLAGVPGMKIDVGSDISETQIIEKLRALSSPQVAQQSGFHASSIANAISNAWPSGNLTKDAANTIIATMLVDLQRDRDFNRYYDAYIRRFGTSLNVYENFNSEMGDRYEIEKLKLKEAMTIPSRIDEQGQQVRASESRADILRRVPSSGRRFDELSGLPGLARYWRTN